MNLRKKPDQQSIKTKKKVKKKVMNDSSSHEKEVIYKDIYPQTWIWNRITMNMRTLQNSRSIVSRVCKVFGKKSVRHYGAQIEEVVVDGYNLKFFEKQAASIRFRFSKSFDRSKCSIFRYDIF